MTDCGLTKANFLATLPPVLANDERMRGIADAIAEILAGRVDEIQSTAIYENIDTISSELLSILAYDFKVDWWDNSYSDLEKRSTLRQSWQVHHHMGTPAAIVAAINAIYPGTIVKEWFEDDYRGLPYRFKLLIPVVDGSSVDPEKHERVMRLLAIYKNTRSVLDGVEYVASTGSVTLRSGTAALSQIYTDVGFAETLLIILVDQNGNTLTDENDNILIL